ncbi:MAG: DUF6391 domain-containing protein [Chloroflexi bacterium]|nr:DUF6391 domain-containing protein [Chloroflexota bacterium]
MNILETAPISTVRRNHGIEHATVHVLTAQNPNLHLVGRADTTGFNIYGDVPSAELDAAAHEAVQRLQHGEASLAVHPRCGTNLVVAGLLTGIAAALAFGRRPSLRKLPDAILATTMAAFLAQPLGMSFQEHVTTSPLAGGAHITGIRQQKMGRVKAQHVNIEWE